MEPFQARGIQLVTTVPFSQAHWRGSKHYELECVSSGIKESQTQTESTSRLECALRPFLLYSCADGALLFPHSSELEQQALDQPSGSKEQS